MFSETDLEILHFTDGDLREAWNLLISEDKLSYFCAEKKYENFLKKLLDIDWCYLVYYKNKLAGMFVVENFEHDKCARLHFAVFAPGKWIMLRGTRFCMQFLFQYFDTLICWIPENNKLSCQFAKTVGAKVIGMIPTAIKTARGYENAVIGYFNIRDFDMSMPDAPSAQAKPKTPAPRPQPIDETNREVRDAKRGAREAEASKFNRQDTNFLTGALSNDPDKLGKKKLLGG